MQVIVNRLSSIHSITGRQPFSRDIEYKKIQYHITSELEDGLLVYNTLTREMVLLSKEEKDIFLYSNYLELDQKLFVYLVEHWFLIPSTVDDVTICYLVKAGYKSSLNQNTISGKNAFTILTTTTCNARCPYCYEYGIRKYSMSDTVSKDVSQYIANNARGNISIRWFGGEPLCNHSVISTISSNLISNNVPFTSSIISNGLLFNDISDETIVDVWKLRSAQITIDGTHDNYNNTKRYIGADSDPYFSILNNINRLLDIGVRIIIRLNISNDNIDDMLVLVDELLFRFGEKENFQVYPYPIFEGFGNPPYTPSDDERLKLYNNCIRIHEKIHNLGLGLNHEVQHMKTHHCMADSGNSIVILPDGNLSLCQHYDENEICGSVYSKRINREKQKEWRKQTKDIPECRECFYHPICYRLEKCSNEAPCSNGERMYIKYKTKLSMQYSYHRWKSNQRNGEKNR